jgi:formylglycine-generating enzyme required for sulfatase activity/cephalosporin-C deacetylase-like acetyl esterase
MEISPERWIQVKELFEAALECDPAHADEFLRRKNADEIVLEEVRRLLAENDRVGSFLSKSSLMDYRLTPVSSESNDDHAARKWNIALATGTRLGPYEIIAPAGAGGMGEVFRARDTRLNREVAIKVLSSRLNHNTNLLARFELEAKAISGLQHPNICVLHDIGRENDVNFLVMEFLDGETLAARLQEKGPLPLDEVLKTAAEIAGALSMAHRKGIIHRDLKPGNIMLTATGAKLLDFGLAKYVGHDAYAETLVPSLSNAQVLGTPLYMSPEQLHGMPADESSDIFAFGAVLYEMLTGQLAFPCRCNAVGMATLDWEEPKPLRQSMKGAPADLEHLVQRCLRKRPEDRYPSICEIERELNDCCEIAVGGAHGVTSKILVRRIRRPIVAFPILFLLLTLTMLSAWLLHRTARTGWARDQALPQIARLDDQGKNGEAYALAVEAERYIPNDQMLAKYWPDISWSVSINTRPPGVSVFRRNYNTPNGEWEFVGKSPIEKRRFALVDSEWKFELPSFTTVERASFAESPPDLMTVTMDEKSKAPAEMVRVEFPASASVHREPVSLRGHPGYEQLPSVPLDDFWIDKYEVTNAQFKRFLDQRGYEKPEYWKQEFRANGRDLSWAEAMKLFRDKTGRSGPATWIQGEYPHGQDDLPVTGVSWFEASAYAEFAGKKLPTIYHWKAAASPQFSAGIIPASNFGGDGPAPVGTYHGMSWSGTYDMAGNVKEWILNEASSGKRFIMGGAWNEPAYMFNDPDSRSPFERSPNFGFRCARFAETAETAKAAYPITFHARDFSRERPVTDQIFQIYKGLYSYDKTQLNAVVEQGRETPDWKMEKITFDAAYGNERMTAYLFLPRNFSPPFQAVVYFPGASALRERSSANGLQLDAYEFVIKSGRAVIVPVYKSTYEREDNLKYGYPNITIDYRDHVIDWSKDLGRSIDYLETRTDIDHNKLAYEGVSWGASMGSIFPAVEPRLKAIVLISPGFYLQKPLAEVDQLNFAPHVKAPVLMLDGRFDSIFPIATSQEPMFLMLGTAKDKKRRVVYDTGHDIPQIDMIKETVGWLNQYLGAVK